jgi:hypothetical protein
MRLVNLRLGEGRVGPEHDFLAQFLLPLNFWQQQFLPVFGTVNVVGAQLRSQTVTFAVEKQQRVIAGGREVAVVGALLLLTVHRNLGRVHVQNDPQRGIQGFRLADEPAVDAGQAAEVLLFGQHFGLKALQARGSAGPRSQIFSETISRNVGSCESRSASLTSS